MPGITLLGLGPGNPNQLTREAWDVLTTSSEIWLRTRQHPTLADLPANIALHSFDELYDKNDTFEAVYAAIVQKILELGEREEGVVYAVPGHPFVAEATGPEIARIAPTRGLSVRVVEGLSFLEPTFSALGLDPFPRVSLTDALGLAAGHVPDFPPDAPALVCQLYSQMLAAEVKMTLMTVYPDEHPVRLVHGAGTESQIVEDIALYEIDRSKQIGLLTALYIPALGKGSSFEAFQEIIAHLRAPEDGCPWDKEQTHLTLRKHLLEESYETISAMDEEDPDKMREEFGDLLLQIVLNAQIASEYGEFSMAEVLTGIYEKIVRRHPHVFGDTQVGGVGEVLSNWEKIKSGERKKEGNDEKGLLDGLPAALPALSQAQEFQDRAARVGFDWPEIDGVLEKVKEEIEEVRAATTAEELTDELGDLFFALVNLARWKKIDSEAALRQASLKFKKRFKFIEKRVHEIGRPMQEMGLKELDELWNEAKKDKGKKKV